MIKIEIEMIRGGGLDIFLSPYKLKFKNKDQSVNGFLLKLKEDNFTGYSTCHSWTHLGSDPLPELIKNIQSYSSSGDMNVLRPIAKNTILNAMTDLKISKAKGNTHNIKEFPKSYALVPEITTVNLESYKHELVLKFKMGFNLKEETQALKKIMQESHPKLKVILDFNTRLSFPECDLWLTEVKDWLLKSLLYMEDPCTFEQSHWGILKERHRVPLALDIEIKNFNFDNYTSFEYIILKPASQDIKKLVKLCEEQKKKFVITSYMAHPIDQIISLYTAAEYMEHPLYFGTGVLTHEVYTENKYSANLIVKNGVLHPSGGAAWGFHKELIQEDWIPINKFKAEQIESFSGN